MYRSVKKEALTPNIVFMMLEAPRIDSRTHACQFVIIRTNEAGRRLPHDKRREKGTMDKAFSVLGTRASMLASLSKGESVTNPASPRESLRMLRNSAGVSALAAALDRLRSTAQQIFTTLKAIML